MAAVPGDVDGGWEGESSGPYGDINYIDYQLNTFNNLPKIIGNLTWNGDSRQIKWTADPSSADNVPVSPADPVSLVGATLNNCFNDPHCESKKMADGVCDWWCRYSNGVPEETYQSIPSVRPYDVASGFEAPESLPRDGYPVDAFTSEPLPRDVHIDPRRGIDVVLFLQVRTDDVEVGVDGQQQVPCDTSRLHAGPDAGNWMEPYWPVELWAGNVRVGGGIPPNDWNVWGGPPAADGYGMCKYTVHPEVPFLAKGSVLTLKVIHAREKFHWAYGLQGDHRSQVRIAEFSTQDLLKRRPHLFPAGGADGTVAGGTGFEGAAIAGLAFAAPMVRGARRRLPILAVALLLAVGASGCLSDNGGPKGTGGNPSGIVEETLVPLREDEIRGAGNGSIFGAMVDDLNYTIAGVRITLEGTPNWTMSAGDGSFRFAAIPEGAYKLRFDHAQYRFFEREVTVKAGQGTSLRITLFLKNPLERDARVHPHDNWNGQPSVQIVRDLVLPSRCDEQQFCKHPRQMFMLETLPGQVASIFPGTTEVEVKLDWDTTAMGVERLGLSFFRVGGGFYDLRVGSPRAPNEPFRIQTTQGMTDHGHAIYSMWRFFWFIPLGEGPDFATTQSQRAPAVDSGDIKVNVRIYRGEAIVNEPGHPDFWKGKDTLPGGQGVIWPTFQTMPVEGVPCADVGPQKCSQTYFGRVNGARVPPDAKKVTVEAMLSRSLSPLPSEVDFYYKSGAGRPLAWSDQTLTKFVKVDPGTVSKAVESDGSIRYQYTIPVTSDTADPFYGQAAWAHTFRFADEDAAWLDARIGELAGAGGVEPVRMSFAMTVHRNA